MPRPRCAMRKIREVLRLSHAGGLSPRQVAWSVGLTRATATARLAHTPNLDQLYGMRAAAVSPLPLPPET